MTKINDPTAALNASWIRYNRQAASQALATNTHNRKLRPEVVRRYAQDMATGDWLLNGETIKFGKDGILLDGQHRLAAVQLAAESVPSVVVTMLTVSGLDPAVQNVTDTGLKRSPADVLHLAGIKNANQLSSTIRCIVRFDTARIFDSRGSNQIVTNSEMLHWLEANPSVLYFMDTYAWKIRKTNVPPSAAAAAFWMILQQDQFGGAEFLERLVTLEDLPKGSPIGALARRVAHLRINRVRLEAVEWAGMICRAWNAWAGQETQVTLRERAWTAATFPWPQTPAQALARREAELAREGR